MVFMYSTEYSNRKYAIRNTQYAMRSSQMADGRPSRRSTSTAHRRGAEEPATMEVLIKLKVPNPDIWNESGMFNL